MAADAPTPDQRILRSVAATLSWQPVDADGTAATPAGTVTVDVARADGTALVTAGATSGATDAPRTYALSAALNDRLDYLTATWKVAGTAVATTAIEVVGGYYASIAQIRASHATLVNMTKYPDAVVLAARWAVEDEFERITDRAFVPRYWQGRRSGSGGDALVLPHWQLRQVRLLRFYTDGATYTSASSTELAAIPASPEGVAVRTDGNVFDAGCANVLVGYEHGTDRPPADILRAFYTRVRAVLNDPNSGIPDRATTYTPTGGGTFALATPGSSWFETGIPDVDAVLQRYPARAAIG